MTSVEKSLSATSAFEGEGWGGVSNAGDGQGWSALAISWCIGQGTLQGVLKAMYAAGNVTFRRCMTQHVANLGGKVVELADELLKMCDMPAPEGVKWCDQHQDERHQPLPHWKAAFFALGQEPGFRKVQIEKAQYYVNDAKAMMHTLGFMTERAYALCFDIAVQCGSISNESSLRYHTAINGKNLTEQQKLVCLAKAVAPQGGQWAADVLSRKLTIAEGKGDVHGKYFDLARDFGIGDGPFTE